MKNMIMYFQKEKLLSLKTCTKRKISKLTMESHKYLSYNVVGSGSLAGLSQLLRRRDLDLIFLQEIYLGEDQLKVILGQECNCSSNIDPEDERKPGTAIAWKAYLEAKTVNYFMCRIQSLKIGG